jgi:hypothetical protein
MAFCVILRVITQPNINLIENGTVDENIIADIYNDNDDDEIMHEPTILEMVMTYFNIICGTINMH